MSNMGEISIIVKPITKFNIIVPRMNCNSYIRKFHGEKIALLFALLGRSPDAIFSSPSSTILHIHNNELSCVISNLEINLDYIYNTTPALLIIVHQFNNYEHRLTLIFINKVTTLLSRTCLDFDLLIFDGALDYGT